MGEHRLRRPGIDSFSKVTSIIAFWFDFIVLEGPSVPIGALSDPRIRETLMHAEVPLGAQQLMKDILRRVPDALDRLHKRYRAVLKSIIMQVLHDEAEADDVLQEVFLQVWGSGPQLLVR